MRPAEAKLRATACVIFGVGLAIAHQTAAQEPAQAGKRTSDVRVDAEISFPTDRKMSVSFEFRGRQETIQYTAITLPRQQRLDTRPSSTPYLLGRLVLQNDAPARSVQEILLGISGQEKAKASLEIALPMQLSNAEQAIPFEIGFPRRTQLEGELSVPGITYGAVRQVTIIRPEWSRDVQIKGHPEAAIERYMDKTIVQVSGTGVLQFDVIPASGGWLSYVTTLAVNNFMFLLLPLFFGSIASFLTPARVHRMIRISLGIAAAALLAWLAWDNWPLPQLPIFASDTAPLIALELGLILCVIAFERLDELLTRFGAR